MLDRVDPRALVAGRLRHQDPVCDRFVAHVRGGHEDSIAAVVFYGSLLASGARTPTSYHDFYVLIDSLAAYHARWRDRLVGRVLPPSVYFRIFELGEPREP